MVLPASWEAHIKILGFCDEDRHCSCSLFFRINFLTHAGPLNQEYMYSQLLSFFFSLILSFQWISQHELCHDQVWSTVLKTSSCDWVHTPPDQLMLVDTVDSQCYTMYILSLICSYNRSRYSCSCVCVHCLVHLCTYTYKWYLCSVWSLLLSSWIRYYNNYVCVTLSEYTCWDNSFAGIQSRSLNLHWPNYLDMKFTYTYWYDILTHKLVHTHSRLRMCTQCHHCHGGYGDIIRCD